MHANTTQTYTCMHACKHSSCTYTSSHTCKYSNIFIYTCKYACIHKNMYVCIHICMLACTHTCMLNYTPAPMYTHMHVHIFTSTKYVHAYIHELLHTITFFSQNFLAVCLIPIEGCFQWQCSGKKQKYSVIEKILILGQIKSFPGRI